MCNHKSGLRKILNDRNENKCNKLKLKTFPFTSQISTYEVHMKILEFFYGK